ncbi:MAG: hypothetical protein ACE5EX_09945, partial [Phycisphaerae bacterium]
MSENPRENHDENPHKREDQPTAPTDVPTMSAGGSSSARLPAEPPPERIGPYRIREQIGEGGMGV